jgi:dsRNA-specific ribonuclease
MKNRFRQSDNQDTMSPRITAVTPPLSIGHSRDQTELNLSNDEIVLYILNEKNINITTEYIESTLKKYNVTYKVNNITKFEEAMTHTSYLKKDFINDKNLKLDYICGKDKEIDPIVDPSRALPLRNISYERLEFLGDSVIHLILADYLYNRYNNQFEGFMTRLRTKIENGQSLAYLTKALDLNKYIVISKMIEQCNGREKNVHILEDAFESFVGALYLDLNMDFIADEYNTLVSTVVKSCSNWWTTNLRDLVKQDKLTTLTKKFETDYPKQMRTHITDWLVNRHNQNPLSRANFEICRKFVISVIEKEIDISELLYHETNYKDSLLQYYHKMKWVDPAYDLLELICQDNRKLFKMCVKGNNNEIVGTGIGSSKKSGQQQAAKEALLYFGVIKEESDDSDDEILDNSAEDECIDECEINRPVYSDDIAEANDSDIEVIYESD